MNNNSKKLILVVILFFIIVVTVPFLIYTFRSKAPAPRPIKTEKVELKELEEGADVVLGGLEESLESSRALGRLPMGEEKIGFDFSDVDESYYIEYVSFSDFYKPTREKIEPAFEKYSLPLNIKTEVVNYYDLSRRIEIDSQLESLGREGFSLMDSPLVARDFYGVYEEMYEKRIPFFISADFLIYSYQENIKKIFKDVEKNIFYKNLWDINFVLFDKAKKRYENTLAQGGYVNDRVLEAERLSAAYFATALKLLSPKNSQVAGSGELDKDYLFSFLEKDIYTFTLPDYLEVDVSREVDLILTQNKTFKSPVLLYERDYREFKVPAEYSSNAKLNNFYLTTKWLSSTFPVHYKGDDCRECFLDFDDWRISMISSAIIADDIFNNYNLKNDWARIYKTLAFFKGLRGDLTYVHYRDALVNSFGDDFEIAKVFADDNPDSVNNLYKFQAEILRYDFLEIEGAFDKNSPKDKPFLGVKMLADFYWPNDFIFNNLSYPHVSDYLGERAPSNNVTFCRGRETGDRYVRCSGFSLDIIALISDVNLSSNEYYKENSFYSNYSQRMNNLKDQISKFPKIWHYNNYWHGLKTIKDYIDKDKNNFHPYVHSSDWRLKDLYTAVGAWINLQMPMEELKVHQKYQKNVISSSEASFIENIYLEPSIELIEDQLATTLMIYEMFSLLKITEEFRSSFLDLEELKTRLESIKDIMVKEIRGEKLELEELNFLVNVAREYKKEKVSTREFFITGANGKKMTYSMPSDKLGVIVFKRDGANRMAVGPVFSYIEK